MCLALASPCRWLFACAVPPFVPAASPDHDVCFTWNGTTSGVCVPNADWISDERTGLTLNDATSAAFAMDINWSKVSRVALALCSGEGCLLRFSCFPLFPAHDVHAALVTSPRARDPPPSPRARVGGGWVSKEFQTGRQWRASGGSETHHSALKGESRSGFISVFMKRFFWTWARHY